MSYQKLASAIIHAKTPKEVPAELRAKRYREYYAKYGRKRDPIKARAHQLVDTAIKNGVLVRPKNCGNCLQPCKPEAHHDDYSKPLKVKWLCRTCHQQRHPKGGSTNLDKHKN